MIIVRTRLLLGLLLAVILSGCPLIGRFLPPDPPTNLAVLRVKDTEVRLSWLDNSYNETGFELQRFDGIDGAWFALADLEANVRIYLSQNLDTESRYSFRTRSVNQAGSSDYSSQISVDTLPTGSAELEPTITITITAPLDQASVSLPFSVECETSEWEVQEGTATHFHLFVDETDLRGAIYGCDHDKLDLEAGELAVGFHQLTLKLATHDHQFIGVVDTVEVEVVATSGS